jgi:hypothetical protein
MNKTIFKMFTLLILPLLAFADSIHGQRGQTLSGPGVNNMFSPRQWREDIDYMVKRLEITHPDLYASVTKDAFHQGLNELLQKSETNSDVNMLWGISELLALIKDGHTWAAWGSGKIKDLINVPPISVFMFSDGLFITSAINKYRTLVGKKIVKIGSVSTEEFMRRRSRTKSADNQQGRLVINIFIEELRYLNILGPGDGLPLTLEDGKGVRSDVEIETMPLKNHNPAWEKNIPLKNDRIAVMNENAPNPLPLWISRLSAGGDAGDPYWFTYLPERKALYVQINECRNKAEDPFDKFYERMFKTLDEKGAQRLIIDVRNNVGGDHFEQPLLLGIIERPNINKPDKLFLITGRFTFSSAQHLVNQLARYTRVTTFGEPTAARPNFFGAQKRFNLPNSGIQIAVSSKLWQDAGPNDFRVLTAPDFYVLLSSADFANNRDPVLERIFAFDSYKNMRPDFSETLGRAYKDGGFDKVKKDFHKIKPLYEKFGFHLENLLVRDFDEWISGRVSDEEYIAFYRFLRQELPDSPDVCWSLALLLNQPENGEERADLYKKCLAINPAHRLARMQLNLMELEKTVPSKARAN